MEKAQYKAIVRELISEHFSKDIDKLSDDENLVQALELNSLTRMEMIILLRRATGIVIQPEEFTTIYSINDLVDYLYLHQKEA
jgi:acyl carrier protein